jgi:ribosome-associated translation inhibitor RaiA
MKFLGGYNFHGSLNMKVEGQTRNINTQQCNEVEQKTKTHENALRPSKEPKTHFNAKKTKTSRCQVPIIFKNSIMNSKTQKNTKKMNT